MLFSMSASMEHLNGACNLPWQLTGSATSNSVHAVPHNEASPALTSRNVPAASCLSVPSRSRVSLSRSGVKVWHLDIQKPIRVQHCSACVFTSFVIFMLTATPRHVFHLSVLECASMKRSCVQRFRNQYGTTFIGGNNWKYLCKKYTQYQIALHSLANRVHSVIETTETIATVFAGAWRYGFSISRSCVKNDSTDCDPERLV